MAIFTVPFVLLNISVVLTLIMLIYILRMKNKSQIYYALIALIFFIFIWGLGYLLEMYTRNIFGQTMMFFVYMWFLGLCFVPVSILFTGLIFAHTKIKFSWIHNLLIVIPFFDYLVIITNKYHNLFFNKYLTVNANEIHFGSYFLVHTIIDYAYIIAGLYYLIYFSIKNAGFFSKQSILIILGMIVPFAVNISFSLKIIQIPPYTTAITFSFAIICWAIAILKFQFLNVVPIAIQKIVDLISDSYIVINENMDIIDYNKTFIDTFAEEVRFKRKDNFLQLLKKVDSSIEEEKFYQLVSTAIIEKRPISIEKQIIINEFNRHFTVEITPIFSQEQYIGTIILLKDITQHKKDLELIEQTHNQLLQRDRLASLGEIAGGVAHDINSPLSAVQSGLYVIKLLAEQYDSILEKNNLFNDDVKSISAQLNDQVGICNSSCTKIAGIVNSVRNHTRNLSGENIQDFYVGNVLNDIAILLNHQLTTAGCQLKITEEDTTMIKGDPGKLGQVLTNLIVNAIQAYNKIPGAITANVSKKDDKVIISVSDTAGGIPKQFQDGIFKNILTTKGTEGTGMGLYMCYSIITAHFRGDIWFDSVEGQGTTFYIAIPLNK